MISLAVVLSYLSSMDIYGQFCQYASVFVILSSGFRVVFFSKDAEGLKLQISAGYFMIGLAVPLLSTIAVILSPPPNSSETYVVLQGALLFLVASSLIIHLSEYGAWWILREFSRGFLLIVIITIIFEYGSLIDSLTFVETEAGRVRFSPFGNHPNLTGHIFSLAAICFAFIFYVSANNIREKIIWVSAFLISTCYVLAASSRGSFVGLVFSVFFVFILYIKDMNARKREVLLMRLFCFSIVFFIYKYEDLYRWLFELFELDSDYRGVGSGGTGRFENWISILERVNGEIIGIFIGNGLRSWSDDYYGHATDSSYLNSIWESGYFVTLFLIVFIIQKIVLIFMKKSGGLDFFVVAILTFVAVESIFARYLVAIGNPGSLLVLVVLIGSLENSTDFKR